MDGDNEALRLFEDREPDMRREPCAEPEGVHLVTARALVTQPELDHVREQLRNRASLDEVNLPLDERGQRLAVDPGADPSSFPLIYINSAGMPTRSASAASPTGTVQLRLLKRA